MNKPMTWDRLQELKAADAVFTDEAIASGAYNVAIGDRRELIAEVERMWGLFEKLAAATGRLDFDRSESGLPQTEEQWIEFVREVHEHAEKIIDQYEGN